MRFLLGLAGGVALPLAQSVTLAQYPDDRRTLGVGFWGVMSMAPFTIGVFMGGFCVRIHPLIRKSLFARRVDIIFENFGAHFRALTLKWFFLTSCCALIDWERGHSLTACQENRFGPSERAYEF
jgi:MFS family permease